MEKYMRRVKGFCCQAEKVQPRSQEGLAFKHGHVAHSDAAYLKVAFYVVQFLWCFGELVQDVATFTEHFL